MYNVSIIIPHHNSPKKLKRLLDSVPNKDDIEVIVVDDRSTKELDLFDEVKNEYLSKNINFFSNDRKNKGAGTCRNIGLEKAQGKWLLFADADDYFINDFYTKIKTYFNDNYDIVFFQPTSWDEHNNKISNRHETYANLVKLFIESNNDFYLRYQFVVPWSKLFRRDFVFYNSVKFDEVIASNDIMFSIKTGYYAKRIQASKETIYCVTKSKGTLTQNISLAVFRARLDAFIRNVEFLKSNLSKNEFQLMNYNGRGYLINTFKYKLGLKEFISTFKKLRRHKIKFFDLKLVNPFFIIKKVVWHFKDVKNERDYKIK